MNLGLLLEKNTEIRLNNMLANPAGSYLFIGNAHLGKFTAAKKLAGKLASSTQKELEASSDILIIDPPKKSISIEQVKELGKALALKSRSGRPRSVIVNEAHKLTLPAQNALLKILEEPPKNTIIILVSDHLDKLLPTIRSRCKIIKFSQSSEEALAEFLVRNHSLKKDEASKLAKAAEGKPGEALSMLTDKNYLTYRVKLDSLCDEILTKNTGGRLVLAQNLLKDENILLDDLAKVLLNKCRAKLYKADLSEIEYWQKNLKATTDYMGHLETNVNKKIAFTNLMVNL